jgi:hypothetical protein
MKRKLTIVAAVLVVLAFALLGTVGASPTLPRPLAAGPVGSGFTYQGKLTYNGAPANGQYDIRFTLWNSATAGIVVGGPTEITLDLEDGLFTVQLNFGDVFRGEERHLEIEVRPHDPPGGSWETLWPRQPITAAPFALGLRFGAVIEGSTSSGGSGLVVTNSGISGGDGIYAKNSSGLGGANGYSAVHAVSDAAVDGFGVVGDSRSPIGGAGVGGFSNGTDSAGVLGWTNSPSGVGVRATYNGGGGGAALEVNNGAIKVSGANRTAFQYATTGHTCASNSAAMVDNPLTNGNGDALLFVQPLYDAYGGFSEPVVPYYLPSDSADCLAARWYLVQQDAGGFSGAEQYNILVIDQ